MDRFLAPQVREVRLDQQGWLPFSQFHSTDQLEHPLGERLIAPSIMLFQPILMRGPTGAFIGQPEFGTNYLTRHLWPGGSGEGVPIRQTVKQTTVISNPDELVESRDRAEVQHAKELVAQTFVLQNRPSEGLKLVSDDSAKVNSEYETVQLLRKQNIDYADLCSAMTPEEWTRACQKAIAAREIKRRR